MKVWHVISGDLWAGAEAMACTLLAGLQRWPEVDPAALVLNEGRLAERLRKLRIPVTVLDERRHTFFSLVLAARRILAAEPADVVHSHRYKENLLAFLACRPPGRSRLVATQHGLPEGDRAGLRRRLGEQGGRTVLARGFSRTVAVAREVRDRALVPWGVPTGRISVVHNGIDLPQVLPPSGRPRPVLGSVGRLVPVKDYALLVEVARALADAGQPFEVRVAGSGPQRETLRARIASAGLDRTFRLEGEVADIDGFYRGIDVYLNTSRHEGLPMSVLEAMGRGLPVVAPAVGGLTEIVSHGRDGYLVDSREPGRFAAACLELLRDPGRRAAMGRAARSKVAEAFSAEAMTAAYLGIYREVLEESGCAAVEGGHA